MEEKRATAAAQPGKLEILFWNSQKGPFKLGDLGIRHLRKITQI